MKVLLFLSAFLTVGAAVLGWMNRSSFIDTRRQKDAQVREVENALDDIEKNQIAKITDVKTQWQEARKAYNADNFLREKEDKEAKSRGEEKLGIEAKTTSTQKEIDTMVKSVTDALASLGISKPEELGAKRDAMRADVLTLTEEVSKLDKEIEVLNSVIAENARQIGKQSETQSMRSKAIALSNGQGIVTAVNGDWAFVVINVGKSDGVSSESQLLVKRGLQLLGKLKIRQIENNLTVADIDAQTLKGAILPGDQVIFANAN